MSSLRCPHNQGQKEGPKSYPWATTSPYLSARLITSPTNEKGGKEGYGILLQAISSQELETGENRWWLKFPEPGV